MDDEQKSSDFVPVWGAKKIGKAINENERRTLYMLEKGMLPARKVGNRWVAEMGALRRAITVE